MAKLIWLGLWGAIQGAKNAKTMKMRTSAIPIAASQLWRPSEAAADHVVETEAIGLLAAVHRREIKSSQVDRIRSGRLTLDHVNRVG